MIDNYDKPLHAPLQYKTMESPAQELDEVALDATIADLIGDDTPSEPTGAEQTTRRPEFPDLRPQEPRASQPSKQVEGVGSVLRQKWAQLSGAA
ncbi:MAG: hypothetical protein AB3N07_12780 [Ruegeria sp.]